MMVNIKNHSPAQKRFLGLEHVPADKLFSIYRGAIRARRLYRVYELAGEDDFAGIGRIVSPRMSHFDDVISAGQKAIEALEEYRQARSQLSVLPPEDFTAPAFLSTVEQIESEIEQARCAQNRGKWKRPKHAPPKRPMLAFVYAMVDVWEAIYGKPMPQSTKSQEWLEAWSAVLEVPSPTEHLIKAALRLRKAS